MSFVPYPSTPDFPKFLNELKRKGESYLENGTFLGTIKLHGTNASIVLTPSTITTPQYQSRNKCITPQDDNSGTAAFLSKLDLTALVNEILQTRGTTTFEEIFICGEFCGKGIHKGVAVATFERFYTIFNIRIDGHWVDMRKYHSVQMLQSHIYNVVNFPTYEVKIDFKDGLDEASRLMEKYTKTVTEKCPFGAELPAMGLSLAAGKNLERSIGGEGIVWTLVPQPDNDTLLYNFKTKGEQFAVTSRLPKAPPPDASDEFAKATAFVDFAVGERRLEQGLEYLVETGKDPKEMKNVAFFIQWVVGDVLKEEGWRMPEMQVNEKYARKVLANRAKIWYTKQQQAVT